MTVEEAAHIIEQELKARWVVGTDPMWASDWNKPYYCNIEEIIFKLNEVGVPDEGCSQRHVPKKRVSGDGATPAKAMVEAITRWKEGKFR